MAGSSTADLQVVRSGPEGSGPEAPAFYLDLCSPESYLVAERILGVMPGPCEWVPVPFGTPPLDDAMRADVERVAAERGLQPVRWPPEVPFDSGFALRAATYAKGGGKVVAFCLAALRQAFAGGRDLSVPENVLIAGAACEIHPRALLTAADTRGVASSLQRAAEQARERGVVSVPAVWAGGEVFHGDAALEAAADAARR
jgi:2-hydroxychromene-2-carboxylate isomerase